jgi:hypothetical protein
VLDPLSTWTNALLSLPPDSSSSAGIINFVAAIATLMNKIQAGPTGTPGIFTLNQSVFISNLSGLTPTGTNSWVNTLANAWNAAVSASVITPDTVTAIVWTASGVDTLTSPSATTTIVSLSTAYATLVSELMAIATLFLTPGITYSQVSSYPQPLAQAFRDATLAFEFNCIGVESPSTPVPIVFQGE